jgi:hypothetical protein
MHIAGITNTYSSLAYLNGCKGKITSASLRGTNKEYK